MRSSGRRPSGRLLPALIWPPHAAHLGPPTEQARLLRVAAWAICRRISAPLRQQFLTLLAASQRGRDVHVAPRGGDESARRKPSMIQVVPNAVAKKGLLPDVRFSV